MHPVKEYARIIQWDKAYTPGKFYQRELKPLLKVIQIIAEPVHVFIIDGYCYVTDDKEPGLGTYLYEALDQQVAIVGVAKNRFKPVGIAEEVFRGQSKNPLYVTSIGIPQAEAALNITRMAGKFRMPDLLKQADQKAREWKASE